MALRFLARAARVGRTRVGRSRFGGSRFGAALFAAVLAGGGASAQTEGPFGGFKHDNTAPIEITADSLEVRQADNMAIFQGEVVAGQGTLRLTADRVEVSYAAEGGGETGAIRRMVARGNVFLSNGAETAQGAEAEYDVASGTVRMSGAVVLTQGENAISGERLTIDLTQGTGRIEAAPSGRVTTVFKPSQN